jgi:hypothetical protein
MIRVRDTLYRSGRIEHHRLTTELHAAVVHRAIQMRADAIAAAPRQICAALALIVSWARRAFSRRTTSTTPRFE